MKDGVAHRFSSHRVTAAGRGRRGGPGCRRGSSSTPRSGPRSRQGSWRALILV